MSKSRALEYMITYHEVRYYFILHTIEKLIDSYYQKGCMKEVKLLTDVHLAFTKRDSIKTSFTHNAFHVNLAGVRPELQLLDSSNLV